MNLRHIAACICAATVICVAGCSNNDESKQAASRPAPPMLGDVAAFEGTPNDATFEAIHADIAGGSLSAEPEARLIGRILRGGVPPRIVNGVVADVVTVDFLGAVRYLRQLGVTAQVNPSPETPDMTQRISRLTWLALALRPYADKTPLDLTRMDLRSNDAFVGQAMNLNNADFSQSRLSGGTWRNSELTDSRFDGATTTGKLRCENCSWASARGTLTLVSGRWVVP